MGADNAGHSDARDRAAERCPRCGYDLGGEIETWRDRCPIDGVCAECGLRFRWAELLNPALRRLPWLYEHARSLREGDPLELANTRAFLTTVARSLLPWSFWRNVRPHHKMAQKRLALFVFMLFLAVSALHWIIFAGARLILEQIQLFNIGGGLVSIKTILESLFNAALYPFGMEWDVLSGFSRQKLDPSPLIVFLAYAYFTLFCALIALCAPSFWRSARTLPRHIVRITAYSLTLPVLAYLIFTTASAWVWTSEHYGARRTPAWWQYQTWITPDELLQVAITVFFAVFIWQMIFWWFGFRRGLGMRRRDATLLTALCAFTGVLGSTTGFLYTAAL
ncbi:MAG: hypothetical protein EA376_03425 [Phycisphaeraceae bacterium]|nr:MAG: hypothetical protein EA376_03425 [Phycisphaeraceae bacterium]